MARGRKKADLKVVGGIGHNSGEITDDQRQALTRQHAQKRASLLAAEKKAKAERMNFDKIIKAELGPKGLANIKLLEQLSTPEGEAELKAELERQIQVARWAGLPIGTQADLFGPDRRPVEERAAEDGKRVGLSGGECKPPHQPGTEAYDRWVESWHAGQSVLAAGFKKGPSESELLRPESEDEGDGDDFNEAADGDFGDDTYRPGDEVNVASPDDFEVPAFLRDGGREGDL